MTMRTMTVLLTAVLVSSAFGRLRVKDGDRGDACRSAYELALQANERILSAAEIGTVAGCDIAELRFLRISAQQALSGGLKHGSLDYSTRSASVPRAVYELTERIKSGHPRDGAWYSTFWAKNGKYGILASRIIFDGALEPAFSSIVTAANMAPWADICGATCRYSGYLQGEPASAQAKLSYILGLPPAADRYKIIRLAELGGAVLDGAYQQVSASGASAGEAGRWNRLAVYLALWAAGDSRYASIDTSSLSTKQRASIQMLTRGRPFSQLKDLHWTSDALYVEDYRILESR